MNQKACTALATTQEDSYLDKNQISAGEIVEELVVINLDVRARNYLFLNEF